MSVISRDTNINQSQYWFLTANAIVFNASTINTNSISTNFAIASLISTTVMDANNINASTINTNSILTNSATASLISTIVMDANDINASTLFAYEVFIDNQGLTATPTELLLNGIPLATTANLSSIQDWANFPAIATLDMNGFNILSTNNVVASNINAGTGIFQTLFANNIFALSTYTSTISSVAEVADFGFIGTLSTGSATGGNFSPSSLWGEPSSFYQNLVSSISSFSSDNIVCSTLTATNLTYTSTISSVAEVADFGFIGTLSTGSATGGNFSPSSLWGEPSSFYQNLVSSISSFSSDNIVCSTLTATNFISTSDIRVSTINGATFGTSSIIVEVVGVSTLVSNSISSLGAVLQTALVSTLQFNPSFSPTLDVNLGLGSLFGNLAGAAAGGLGVVIGTAALGTGIAALAQGRQTNNITSTSYELVNGTTQLQISTLGDSFSTIYRFVNSVSPDVPGEEVFVSTVYAPGLAIRSMSDPLNTLSSPNSTIQAFGQWVSLADTVEVVSTFNTVQTSTLSASTISLQGQLTIEPSTTTRSGIYMPYDATNGTGVLAFGLSTSVSIFEKYVGLLPLAVLPIGSVLQETAAFYETRDNEVSFQYADLEVGRLLVAGTNNYGLNPTGYITGDTIGNVAAVALSFSASTLQASTLILSPSTILYSQPAFPELVCGTASDPNDFAQIAASALRLGSSIGASNGIVVYGQVSNRLAFLDGTLSSHTLAYTSEIPSTVSTFQELYATEASVSSLTVSSINNQPAGFRGGQFYRTTDQNLPFSGGTPLTFDTAKSWNSTDFAQLNPTTFVCSTTGTYQITGNANVAAGSGTWTDLTKALSINQYRSGSSASYSVFQDSRSVSTGATYAATVGGFQDFLQGDTLEMSFNQELTSGTTVSLGLANTISLNTFWSYQLMRM